MYRKPSILWPEGVMPSDAYCDEDKRLAVLAAHGTPSASYFPPTMKPEMFCRNSSGIRR